MSIEITTAMRQTYNSNVRLICQQKKSRLRGAVRVESMTAEYDYFDSIGAVAAQRLTSRHADTPRMDTPHLRRRVTTEPWVWSDLIDRPDKVRLTQDPTSSYVQACVAAFNRSMDDVIIEAAFGSAWTGKSGSVEVAFPTATNLIGYDGSVGSDTGTAVGLTMGKLKTAKRLLDQAEVDPEEERFIAVTSMQIENLLGTTEVTSSDYNTVKALVAGNVDEFMGFKFIRLERLPKVGTTRSCLAWAKSGLLLGLNEDVTTRISERGDKNYSVQVYGSMDIGATRMEECKVLKINCKE